MMGFVSGRCSMFRFFDYLQDFSFLVKSVVIKLGSFTQTVIQVFWNIFANLSFHANCLSRHFTPKKGVGKELVDVFWCFLILQWQFIWSFWKPWLLTKFGKKCSDFCFHITFEPFPHLIVRFLITTKTVHVCSSPSISREIFISKCVYKALTFYFVSFNSEFSSLILSFIMPSKSSNDMIEVINFWKTLAA